MRIEIVLAAALIVALGSAQAQPPSNIKTVSTFLTAYDTGTPDARKAYEMAISSAEQGYLYANAYLASHHEPKMYCQPEKLTLTGPQLIDMLRRETEVDGRLAKLPPVFSILDTLIVTFPCP